MLTLPEVIFLLCRRNLVKWVAFLHFIGISASILGACDFVPNANVTRTQQAANVADSKGEEDRVTPLELTNSGSSERAVDFTTNSQAPTLASVEERWGIQVTRVALTAGNGMIDFRFKVVDQAKAAPILSKDHQAVLVDGMTGKAASTARIPKMGELRQRSKSGEEGRTYFTLFTNPEGVLKPGSTVSIIIGDLRLNASRVKLRERIGIGYG